MVAKKRPAKTIIRRDRLLTVGEVEKLTGVTRAMLRDYDEKGLLCPRRSGEDAANNRKLYSLEDIERLKRIVALRAYEFSLREIRDLLDKEEADFFAALNRKLVDLRRREQHLRSLVLFAKYVRIVGGELFEGLVTGPEALDLYADKVRTTALYAQTINRIRRYGKEEKAHLFAELSRIVEAMVLPEGSTDFDALEGPIERFVMWWDTYVEPVEDAGYLGFWAVLEDDTVLVSEIQRVGGEFASGSLQMYLFFYWMKRFAIEERELVETVAAYAETDVIAALAQADKLVRRVARRMGVHLPDDVNAAPWKRDDAYELAYSVLGYVKGILEDEEMTLYLDKAGAVKLRGCDVARAREVVNLRLGEDKPACERCYVGEITEELDYMHKDSSPFR